MIKRILSILLVLVLACAVLPAVPARAEVAGTLYIRGERVTDENCADVLGDGRFSYDPAANVLTVRGSCSYQNAVVANYIPDLTIYIARDVTFSSASDAGLLIRADTTITGPGLLRTEGDYGISVEHGAWLTLRDANVDARGKYWGIDGLKQISYSGNRLILSNSYVHAEAKIYGAIQDFKYISPAESCTLTEPEGGMIQDGEIRDKDGKIAKSVTFEPPKYALWIAGRQVTGSICADVLCSGAFSYDAAAKVLTVKGDCSTEETAIRNEIEGLTVRVEADSRLESTGNSFTVTSRQDLTLTGPGTLTLRSARSGLYVYNDKTLTLENAKLRVYANNVGVASGSEREKLMIRSSELEVHGGLDVQGDGRAFGVFEDLTLEGCTLTEPADGEVKGGTVLDGDGTPAKQVKISEVTYPLWIDGTRVSAGNASDILGDGAFSYDAYTNVLTVRDGFLSNSSTVDLINNQIPGLTLFVAADAELISINRNAITTSRDMTVTGPGALRLGSAKNSGIVVRSGATLTLDRARIEVNARIGLSGWTDAERLVVRNSAVAVMGREAAVFNFTGGLTLEGCGFTRPENARVVDGTVKNEDGSEATEVWIEPQKYGLEIAGTPVDTRNAPDVLGDGVFSFDAAERLLTVSGDCSCASGTVISSEIANLTIYANTDATLRTLNGLAISGWGNFRLTGPGKLTLEAQNGAAVAVGLVGSVTVENAALELNGNYGFVGGSPDPDSALTVRNSAVTIHAMGQAIYCFSSGVSLEGCEITAPMGAVLTNGSSLDEDGNPVRELTIEPEKYSLSIAGTTVDTRNAADILGNGCFAYDADTNVLTVSGSCIHKGSLVIHNRIGGLTVYVAENAFLYGSTTTVMTEGDLTITGPGTLTVWSADGCGILADEGAALTVEDANVIVDGNWGIGGRPSGETLTVRNSNLHVRGLEGAVCDFDGGITFDGCTLTAPSPYSIADGSVWDEAGIAAEVYVVPDVITEVKRSGDRFTYALSGEIPEGAQLLAAAYDAAGRMIAATACAAGAGSFTLAVQADAAVKAFLVGANDAPLCAPKAAE